MIALQRVLAQTWCPLWVLALALQSACVTDASPSADSGEHAALLSAPTVPVHAYAIALHGGAGVIERANMSDAHEAEVRAVLAKAVETGRQRLADGAVAEDVVVEVIRYLEDQPQFNAGKGAVFTYEGVNELDASLMRGRDLQAGAVSGVRGVRHPIALAREVMLHSDHVMLSGAGAVEFADERGVERVPDEYFRTEARYRSWRRARERADAEAAAAPTQKFGTVGCAVRDRNGNLAAGTSTGGMTLKRYGRIGDSPVIGAGTYADNATCAVSATGHGEYFIRYAVAHDIAARMRHGGKSLSRAADEVILEVLAEAGGDGGVIAVDAAGNIAMPFNTPGMYRAYATPDTAWVGIFGDESTR